MNWIKASEQLPPEKSLVLLFNKNWEFPVTIGWYAGGKWESATFNTVIGNPATHWCLIEPPK